MKYLKKGMFLLLLAFFLFLFMGYTIPQKTRIQKSLSCLDDRQKKIPVTISGTYFHYILKDDEIMSKLWPNRKERVENVHKAVGRLRNILHKLDSDIDIKRGVETYQLIL